MSYKKRLQAKLEYATALEGSELLPNRGGGAQGSGDVWPRPKPAMSLVSISPMGIYGLLLHCKGVEENVAHGDDTHAPGSDADDMEFPDQPLDDDEFDVSGFEPSFSGGHAACEGSVPAMPTII